MLKKSNGEKTRQINKEIQRKHYHSLKKKKKEKQPSFLIHTSRGPRRFIAQTNIPFPCDLCNVFKRWRFYSGCTPFVDFFYFSARHLFHLSTVLLLHRRVPCLLRVTYELYVLLTFSYRWHILTFIVTLSFRLNVEIDFIHSTKYISESVDLRKKWKLKYNPLDEKH